jgi:signal transduction histidine kinase
MGMIGINATRETGKVQAASARPPRRRRAGSRGWNDWSVSWRLMAVAIIAILIDVTLGGLRVAATMESTTGFSHVTQLTVLGQRVISLAQTLEDERDQLAGFIAAGRPASGVGAVDSAESRTDAAAAQVTAGAKGIGAGFPAATAAKVTTVLDRIADLPGLRQAAAGTQLPSLPIIMDYSAAIADLFSLNDEIAQGGADPAVADGVRALGDLSRLEEAASRQRALLLAALTEHHFEPGALAGLITAQSAQAGYLQAFHATATPGLQQAFSDQVTGTQVDQAQLIEQRVIATGNPQTAGLGLSAGNPPAQWYAVMTGTLAPIRAVERQLTGSIITQSQALQAGPQRSALLTIVFASAVLIFVLAVTMVVARSLVLPLRRLKTGALEIASTSLPARVRALTEHPDADQSMDVAPICVRSADEIGQVARAFDQVHAEALRLAGNEAILRRNVSAMFVSLSHRSQSGIDRLTHMITTIIGHHPDDALRSDLAAMDRLLIRMRRNCENLLVLAGYETIRKWSGPVPLTEVARAAASGIDPDRRLSVNVSPGLTVVGYAATSVTHLLAELIENAANFSPMETPITLSASEPPDGGIQIDVADSGLGLPADRLDEMNARLADPPVADALVSRHMGLFAVAHLAARHGAQVRLRRATKGTVAQVWLPPAITASTTAGQVPAADTQISGLGPARSGGYLHAAALRQSGAQQALTRTAAVGRPDRQATTGPMPPAATRSPLSPPVGAPTVPDRSGRTVPDQSASTVPDQSGRTGTGLPSRVSRTRNGGRHAASNPPTIPPLLR